MDLSPKHKIVFLTLTLLIAGLTLTIISDNKINTENTGAQATLKEPFKDIVETRNYWIKRIEAAGAEKTYQEFKEAYQNEHFGTQHGVAHIMGELLYEKEGINGLAVCDSTFAFGCYHSFFGRALAERGSEIIPELDKTCVDKFGPLGTGCQHGIGHGILEFMTTTRLVEALEACTETTQVKEFFGCTSGVFMEYNSPLSTNPDGTFALRIRTLNPSNPHEPCNTIVPDKFKKSCYYELAQWWLQVFNYDYQKMGLRCNEVGDGELKKSCYLGIGNIAAPSNGYDVEKSIAVCEKMPDRNGKLLCRTGASWSFYASPPHRTLAPLACEGMTREESEACIKNSDLIGEKEFNEQFKQ